MTSCEGHQEVSTQAVAWEFEEFGFSLWRMSITTLTLTTGLQGIQDPSPVAAGRDLSMARCKAELGWFLPSLFALCRPCSKFKQQFNNMVNTEARQSLGVGLGHPKLRFSVQN